MTRYVPDNEGGEFAVHDFETGVVALDIDAPTDFFTEGGGRDVLVKGARELARELSHKYGLGLYWIYDTLNGVHVIFQCKLASWRRVRKVLVDAYCHDGWHECGGHALCCTDRETCGLRVGCKPGRPFDIWPVPGNPPASTTPHIREHEALLAQRLLAQ